MGHVALFARALSGGGGVERVLVHLAGALAARGHQVDLVLARTKGHFLSELPATVNLVELNAPPALLAIPSLVRAPRTLAALLPTMMLPGVAQVLGAIPALIRYIDKARPDTVLAALDYANITAIVARQLAHVPVRTVASVHNHMSSAAANAERPHLRHVISLAARFYSDADAVICVSAGVADDLEQTLKLPRTLLKTVYNPVVTDQIAELAAVPSPHPWLDRDNVPVILGVGKLRRQKDFANLIQAFAQVRRAQVAKLIILGEGPERSSLESLAQDLGVADEIDFKGFVANPYPYMSRATVFALSSAWEGFGNVLVEAMACGCPVVSTACPSGPAEILADGEFGELVPVADPPALAGAILRQLRSPRGITEARHRALEFTSQASAIAYEKILFPPQQK